MDEGVVKKERNTYTHENLLKDLRLSEPSDFQNFLRLDATLFDELLKMITPRIEKKEYYSYCARCYSFKPAFVRFLFPFFPYLNSIQRRTRFLLTYEKIHFFQNTITLALLRRLLQNHFFFQNFYPLQLFSEVSMKELNFLIN